MPEAVANTPADAPAAPEEGGVNRKQRRKNKRKKRRRSWRHRLVLLTLFLGVLVAVRAALPVAVRWYVVRTIDQSPLYDGEIGDIDLHLWRGAYTIEELRINKVTGNVPHPLFASPRVDLSIDYDALLEGAVVGRIAMHRPELNFIDGEDEGEDQTGAGGPWLEIVQDLFPFKINEAVVVDGSIHFRAFGGPQPVDVYMSHLDASVENLTNIHDDVAPMVATVKATALAMDHAKLQYEMQLDPTSYRPTFQMALRLIGLDVTKVNQLTRAYGQFDFEHGWFDLVVELDAKEGFLEGSVKPLFRNLRVLDIKSELKPETVLNSFWEALIGVAAEVLQNQRREQFGTRIALKGDLSSPEMNILEILGNVLRNAFVRAYLPRLEGTAEDIDWLQFSPGELSDPTSVGD